MFFFYKIYTIHTCGWMEDWEGNPIDSKICKHVFILQL